MDKIKRFITCHVPVYACNFRCSYCYVGQFPNAYKRGIKPFYDTVENIGKAFSVDRLGGHCYFNLCGAGETLLHNDIISLVSVLTRCGHYVDVITNGVLEKRIDEIISSLGEQQRKRFFVKFSFHWLELKKLNLMDLFVSNVHKIRDAGISYSVEITPHDELIDYINEIKQFSLVNFGALPHITVARNEATDDIQLLSKYNKDEYKKIWSVFESPLFDFKLSIFGEKRCEFCYAGVYSLEVNLENGDYMQCYRGDRLGNLKKSEKEFNFRPIGRCRLPHCFNGHSFLAFGNIPYFENITYTQERDRLCPDGTHWLQPECANFFSTKLYNLNHQYSKEEIVKILKQEKGQLKKLKRIGNKIFNVLRK